MNFPKTLVGFYVKNAIKPFKWLVGGWAVCYLFVIIANGIAWPVFQKMFIGLFENGLTGAEFIKYSLPTILFITIVYLLIDSAEVLQSILGSRRRPKLSNHIGEVLQEYTHSQSMQFWTNRIVGKVNSQINYVVNGFDIISDLITMIAMFVVLSLNMYMVLSINKYVALILTAAFAFRVIYGILRIKPMNKASKASADSSSSLSGKVIDSLSNYSIVKLFAGEKFEKAHIKPTRQKNIQVRIHAGYMQRLFWAIPVYIWDVLFGIMLLLCVWLYSSGGMKVSEIVFTMSVYNVVMDSISNIIRRIPDIVDMWGSAQQSYKELIQPIDVFDVPNAHELNLMRGEIVLDKVTFSYGRKKVLDGLFLTIKPGEKIGLVGSSGAGKTTLVNLLMRMYDPKRGAIYFDGQNIHDVTQDSLRKNIAFIPQDPTLFNRTLFENIAYGKPDATLKQVRAAAKKTALDAFIMDSEKKYDSYVGDRGIKLSGGQKQRVAIARAFLKNAPILILDEATSALDSETESVIQKSFNELSDGRTTIAIAHRLSTLRNMDRIIVMDKGKIAESGNHAQLLRKNGIYAKLWKMQTSGFIKE